MQRRVLPPLRASGVAVCLLVVGCAGLLPGGTETVARSASRTAGGVPASPSGAPASPGGSARADTGALRGPDESPGSASGSSPLPVAPGPSAGADGAASPKIIAPNAGFGLTLGQAFATEAPTAVVNYDAEGRVASLTWTPTQPTLTWRAKVLDQAFTLATVRLVLSANVTAYRVLQASPPPDEGGFPVAAPPSAPPIVASPTAFPSPVLPSPVVSTTSRLATETLQLAPAVLGLPTKLEAGADVTLTLGLDQPTFRDYLARTRPAGSVDLAISLVDDGGVAVPAGAGPAIFKGRFTIK
ncbi:MAG: hypothetical protein VKQ33_10610 [Candidatus Sericytochromatia bacterium]|nr:hypothetical protein [Candidatus Sericytochromatia bacterium]